MSMTRRDALALLSGAVAALASGITRAADYPTKPIRLVVPFPAGGASDVIARLTAAELQALRKQSVVVDNKPGANGIIGVENFLQAPADGYTLLAAGGSAWTPAQVKDLKFNVLRDCDPIALVCQTPLALIVPPQLGINTAQEFFAYARKNPGKLNYASVGNGSSSHLNAELLKSMAGIEAVHVPFNGSPPAVLSTVQGETQMIFAVMQPLQAQIQAGKLRAIAVTTPKRFPLLPDLPAVAETYPGFEALAWNGLVVPAATPAAVVQKINAEVGAILKQPEIVQKMNGFGFDLVGGTPADFAALIASEAARWTPVVKALGIKVD